MNGVEGRLMRVAAASGNGRREYFANVCVEDKYSVTAKAKPFSGMSHTAPPALRQTHYEAFFKRVLMASRDQESR